jgi:hypothetical protein
MGRSVSGRRRLALDDEARAAALLATAFGWTPPASCIAKRLPDGGLFDVSADRDF